MGPREHVFILVKHQHGELQLEAMVPQGLQNQMRGKKKKKDKTDSEQSHRTAHGGPCAANKGPSTLPTKTRDKSVQGVLSGARGGIAGSKATAHT